MNIVHNYLTKLTKNELIDLILKFAPQSYINIISAKFSTGNEALVIFNEISQIIEDVICDEELLYSPDRFEQELLKQLEIIEGLWDKLPVQIGELIILIIKNVEQSFEDGYLYIDNYGKEDDYFESEDVNNYIIQFVINLPEEIKFVYIERLKMVIDNCGYSTFQSVANRIQKIKKRK